MMIIKKKLSFYIIIYNNFAKQWILEAITLGISHESQSAYFVLGRKTLITSSFASMYLPPIKSIQ